MTILDFLAEKQCRYRVTEHEPVYSAEQLAEIENVSPCRVAKAVAVRADGQYYLCVLQASCKIDLYTVKKHLGAKSIQRASEQELDHLFSDSELGAEPPLGSLYNLPTLMDKKLSNYNYILFQAGTYRQAVWLSMSDYKQLTEPTIFGFGYPRTIGCPEAVDDIDFTFDPFFL